MTSDPYHPHGDPTNQPAPKSSGNCLLYGCLGTLGLGIALLVCGGFGSYWFVMNQIDKYTSDTPVALPEVELSEEELADIKARTESFKSTIDAGDTPQPLVLTADEINAAIASQENLKGKVFVKIENGQVSGDVSIPFQDRYFNGSATFDVSLENGELIVVLQDATIKGERLPQSILDGFGKQNLARDAYDNPEVAKFLRNLQSIKVEDDKIILIPREQTSEEPVDENPNAEIDASAEPVGV